MREHRSGIKIADKSAMIDRTAIQAIDQTPAHEYGISPSDLIAILRTIGRGKSSAKSLTREQSFQLFYAIFHGQCDPMQLGAALMALRLKGESLEEVAGAIDAVQCTMQRITLNPDRPIVSIPSYNGARNTANLVPLLACLLADAGVQVIVHGSDDSPSRISSASIFSAMGIDHCRHNKDVVDAIARRTPAYVPIAELSPGLDRLLGIRQTLGVRNMGHTICKMLNPSTSSSCLRLVSFTHPEFNLIQHEYFTHFGGNALVMRATEGEAVANTRRQNKIDHIQDGACNTVVETSTHPALVSSNLPHAIDAATTAVWTQSVLGAERPVPAAVAVQVQIILAACKKNTPELLL